MLENLAKLYNTLLLIETKGENTKVMAQCIQFLENMIAEEKSKMGKVTENANETDK